MRIRPRKSDHTLDRPRATDRLEAISDGIFAVAITLLVLDLKVPAMHAGEPARRMLSDLGSQWPVYWSYFLSFVVVGVTWVDHHMMFRFIKGVDRVLLTLNLLVLMVVAVMPYPTALLATSLEYHVGEQASAAIYTSTLLLSGFFWNSLWLYARSRPNLIEADATPAQIAAVTRRWMTWPVVYLIALGISFVSVPLCLVTYILVPIFFFLPTGADRF